MKDQNEKQAIEEMAKYCPCYFGEKCCIDEVPEKCDMLCQFGTYAETIYNAGYRKQSEGEWIIKGNYFQRLVCTNCSGFGVTMSRFCPNCGAKMKGGAE